MLKTILISLLFLVSLAVSTAKAHEGHIHPPSIGRTTHPYLQACIPPYLRIQKALTASKLDDSVKKAAGELAKQAKSAAGQENEATGRAMLNGIVTGAQAIASAGSLDAARAGFGQVNKAMLPFFIIWSGHLNEHELSLFYCASKEALQNRDKIDFTRGWMQKEKEPKSPYGALCSDLQVERGGE